MYSTCIVGVFVCVQIEWGEVIREERRHIEDYKDDMGQRKRNNCG